MIDLISIHIPKTAGRSFLAILNSVYNENSVKHFDRKDFPNKTIRESVQFKAQLTERTKVIHGHFQYKEISDLNDIPSTKVIAWFRDPVDRVISNYYFFKKRTLLFLDDEELQRRRNESLIEYVTQENTQNLMTKFTEGLDLREYYFVGLFEYFNDDLQILGQMLNWKPFQIPKINDNAELKSSLPAATIEEKKIIKNLNMQDIELYKKVLEIHNKRIR